jgi:hypothetical protein
MIEVVIEVGPNMSIFLVQTLKGPRPLRFSGRDFIKVMFTPPNIKPIYQCFYKSTGLHIQAGIINTADITATDTGGVWTPCDGIVIEDKGKFVQNRDNIPPHMLAYYEGKWKRASTYISKVDYFGLPFSLENWVLPESNEDNREDKWFDPCNNQGNKNAILCRFGNCDLIKISYMLSKIDSIFWNSEEGIRMKTLCGINDIIPYEPDIPMGVAIDYLTIDMFIGDALSYNYVDIEPYISLRREYGDFNLENCIVDHPGIGPSILQPMVKMHCGSQEANVLKEVYLGIDSYLKNEKAHMEDQERDFGQIVEDILIGEITMEDISIDVEEEKESNIQLPIGFKEECDKLDIETIKDVAKQLDVNMFDKRGRSVNRKVLCSRIMKKLKKLV